MDTTNTARSSSYFGVQLEIDNESRLRTWVYDKRDDLCENVYLYEVRYSRQYGSYQYFFDRGLLLTRQLKYQVITSTVLRWQTRLG